MLEYIILAVVLYVIGSAIFGRADRKDRKRWPYLMRQEKELLEIGKKEGISIEIKYAAMMRKQRKKARKDEKLAKILDAREAAAEEAYFDDLPRRRAADMEQKMADMQRKINDLEWENRRRY